MDSLGSILPKVLHKRGLHAHATAALVCMKAHQWLSTALPGLREHFSIDRLHLGVLQISCSHSIAAQELTPLLPQLKDYLMRECKGMKIEEIRLMRSKTRA